MNTANVAQQLLHDAPVRHSLHACCERNVRELQAELQAEVHALQLRLKQAADARNILQDEVKRMHAAYDELQRLHHAILAEGRDATEL